MGIVSATILSLLVVGSFSWRAQAFPEGCKKLIGSIEGAIPEEYVVKMTKDTLPVLIVKMMLEMTNSGCEKKVYRTSSASNSVMGPITCSNMLYIDRFGFAAKMSDATVMWVSLATITVPDRLPIFGANVCVATNKHHLLSGMCVSIIIDS